MADGIDLVYAVAALLVRAVALAKLERMEEAIAASGPVFGARVATRVI